MIDAQRAGVAHVGAQRGDERRVSGFAEPIRNQRRQTPVLAAHVEVVGRRADARAHRIRVLVRPRLGAGAIDRYREIDVQPDAHGGRRGFAADIAELRGRLPLQILGNTRCARRAPWRSARLPPSADRDKFRARQASPHSAGSRADKCSCSASNLACRRNASPRSAQKAAKRASAASPAREMRAAEVREQQR